MEHWNWQHERELSRSKGRLGQREELCLELFQVFICVRCFELIGEYSAAACTRSGAFLEQVITTSDWEHISPPSPASQDLGQERRIKNTFHILDKISSYPYQLLKVGCLKAFF